MSTTSDRDDPRLTHGADSEPTEMAAVYLVLSEEERAKGLVRPVRRSYLHEECGSVTTMGTALSETYAANPGFYGATYCCACRMQLPVGADGEFTWIEQDGSGGPKVGT